MFCFRQSCRRSFEPSNAHVPQAPCVAVTRETQPRSSSPRRKETRSNLSFPEVPRPHLGHARGICKLTGASKDKVEIPSKKSPPRGKTGGGEWFGVMMSDGTGNPSDQSSSTARRRKPVPPSPSELSRLKVWYSQSSPTSDGRPVAAGAVSDAPTCVTSSAGKTRSSDPWTV